MTLRPSNIWHAGVDEAGRGPLAGPVFAAAVILKENANLPGLNDSKKLSEAQREALVPQIHEQAHAFAVCSISSEVIDRINILQATLKAMRHALQELPVVPHWVWIDGIQRTTLPLPQTSVVDGDTLMNCIKAASILAKTSRDDYMRQCHQNYPEYGFDRHKGYGTRQHLEALERHGPCPEHRRTFRGVLKR